MAGCLNENAESWLVRHSAAVGSGDDLSHRLMAIQRAAPVNSPVKIEGDRSYGAALTRAATLPETLLRWPRRASIIILAPYHD